MRRTLIVALGLCGTLTACGSTLVEPVSQGAVAGVEDPVEGLDQSGADTGLDGASAPGADDTTRAPGGDDATADGGGGAGTGSDGGSQDSAGPGESTTAARGATGAGRAPSGTTRGTGAGVAGPAATTVDYSKPATGSPVKVGIMYIADLGAASAQFGGTDDGQPDPQRAIMKASVDWMNAHGGLGGHKIDLLYYGAEIAGGKSFDQSQEEMCAQMTEDNKVVAAVISSITVTNNMAQCMEEYRGLYVTDAGYFKSTADWARLSYTASPTELDAQLLGREMAKLTVAKGAAKRGEKVGLLVYDAPGYRAAEGAYTKVAKAAGVQTTSYRITYANSTAELSNSIAAVQSAVLAFRSEGVKTVVSLASGGMLGFFLQNANEQRYYPRYVISSNDGPANAPAAERNGNLKGAIALGYIPSQDVDLFRKPDQYSDPTFANCRQITKSIPKVQSDAATFGIAQRVCSSLLLLQTAAKGHGGTDITGTTLRNGLRRVGSSISAGTTYRTLLRPGKQWAPSHFRSMRYDDAKKVFVYDSALTPFAVG